jgi:hypothetical protein
MATSTTASTASGIKPKGKLEDQAAIAALYVTKSTAGSNNEYLDSNNRLSSAGKFCNPSLPMYHPQILTSTP